MLIHRLRPRRLGKFLFAVLMAVMLIAACDTQPEQTGACYVYDFRQGADNSAGTPINIQSGSWTLLQGLYTDSSGELIVNWSETFFFRPTDVVVSVVRPGGVVGSIHVDLIANAFGQEISRSGDIPADVNDFALVEKNNGSLSVEGNSFNATVQASQQLLVQSVTIYVNQPSPFPTNHCGVPTNTPNPSSTPSLTHTGTLPPSITPTITFTPSITNTPSLYYCYEWDFSINDGGWERYDFSGYGGIQYIGQWDGTQWESTYNSARGARGVAINRGTGSNYFQINKVELDYEATLGGDTDSTADPYPPRLRAFTFFTGGSSVWLAQTEWGGGTFTYFPATIYNIRRLDLIGISAYGIGPNVDNGGEIAFTKLRIFFNNGMTTNPGAGGQFCGATPTPTPTVTSTPVPSETNTPGPTSTRTPLGINTPTPTKTGIVVATRTLPPSWTPAPTNTQPPTATDWLTLPPVTPENTNTPLPTNTSIPVPSEVFGSSTPWATIPGPGLTPLPGTPGPGLGGTLVTPALGTLAGTPPIGETIIATPDNLSDFYPGIEGNLKTAAAQVNTLPRDLSVVMPDVSNLPVFAGMAKWIMSGVSLQEIFGQRIYPIPLHIFYAITAILFVSSIMLGFRFVMWFLKLASFVIRFILKIIPFIG